MKFELTPTIHHIINELDRLNKKVWVVGGAVRDQLLNKKPKDLDLATNYDHNALSVLCKKMGLVVIPDQTALSHGIVRVVDRDTGDIIDIARLRRDASTDGRHAIVEFTENIEEDLARRDFTINSMAAPIDSNGYCEKLIDPFNGRKDIEEKLVTFVGNMHDRIKEDYLRMVRLCRFTALDKDWKIGNPTTEIRKYAKNISKISKERIRDEFLKALAYDKPSNFFRALLDVGLLEIIFPDLEKGVDCEQNEYHAEDVFNHLLRCLDFSVNLTDNTLLRFATLCHDIAKPHTRSVDSGDRVHFYKHEVEGAQIIRRWMKEYKFSKKEIEYVSKLVRHHQWRFEKDSKDKTIRKWLQTVGKDVWRDLITLRCADRKGNLKKAHKPMITQPMKDLISKVEEIIDSGAPIFKEDLAISGHDLKKLGVPPGRIYKDIFSNMLGIVLINPEKNTKEWLENYVVKNYIDNTKHEEKS